MDFFILVSFSVILVIMLINIMRTLNFFLFLLGKWVRYEYSNPSVDYLLHTRIKLGGYGGGYEG